MLGQGKRKEPTPEERARSAARIAAILFDALPSSPYADRCLKPIGRLLQILEAKPDLWVSSDIGGWTVDDAQQMVEEAEDQYLRLLRCWESFAWCISAREAQEIGATFERFRQLIRTAKEQLAALDHNDHGHGQDAV